MDLDDIKRCLRAEIKKRENEQYLTFQCNVRQMCKDVLAKLEEQESEIAELKISISKLLGMDAERVMNEVMQKTLIYGTGFVPVEHAMKLVVEVQHQKYKRCLAMASYWLAVYYQCVDDKHKQNAQRHRRKWLELASKFENKEAK